MAQTADKLISQMITKLESTQQDASAADQISEEKKDVSSSSSDFKNYLAIESVGGPQFHPSSNDVVFVYNASGTYQIYKTLINTKNELPIWPSKLTYSNDRCTSARYLSDGTIIYVSDIGGNERFQLYLIDLNNKIHKISLDINAKYTSIYTTKNYLYFSANIEDKSKFNIYRHKIPILENSKEIICSNLIGICGVGCVSPFDENIICITHYINNSHSENILIDMNMDKEEKEENKKTYLTKKYNMDKKSRWGAIRFIDKTNILCVTNYKCDFIRPVIININTLNIIYFKQIETSSIKWNYGYFTFNDNDKYTYFSQNIHGYSEIYRCIFDIDNNNNNGIIKELLAIKLPFKCVLSQGDQRSYTNAMKLNNKNDLLLITISNSVIPTNIYLIQLNNSMKCYPITNVSTPGINIKQFGNQCKLMSFKSFDNLQINYFRYKPINNILCNKNKKYPTMIIIHGGPESQYRPSFKSLIQFYLAAGFMIIAPNVRGSSGYGRTFMDADNIEKRMDSVKDIHELVKFIKLNDDDIDNDKLIVYGGSYGGFMVLSSITEYPDLFIAAVDIVGISNFVTFLKNTADWRRPLRESEYGSLEKDMDVLIKISPIHKINNIKCPLFIIQGDNDERVPLSESIQIYDKLKDKQLNTVLLRFDDEGHGVTKLKNKIVAYGKVLQWLLDIVK